MARSIEDIQRDIERNRNQLARTLDELTVRTNPKNVADDAKTRVLDALNEPKVQAALGVVAALVVGGIAMGIRRNRNRSKEIDRIREMIETAAK
ncbi:MULTISPECIES: DUF3618 domain-containing protein [Corynebacterium]|nr:MULTISPECIES: DUF3618 domain-containing protein [Corynebacterium]ASE57568.1 DUF3618 domain-containing protein [Corynebacterium jeikeium]MBC6764412.1 DUF3618 domain-containing protein [Corynebacterium sp. LK22]MBC6822328.1 DUF3618 domain-containing protein [Corynebacterium sp. LK33]MCQ9351127.1 DUF3618 domain-containing protein [Corynebacterium sp. 5QC2CO]AYX81299.1 DUF3618 domain-containing protein [Corynebacterium jeikeium]